MTTRKKTAAAKKPATKKTATKKTTLKKKAAPKRAAQKAAVKKPANKKVAAKKKTLKKTGVKKTAKKGAIKKTAKTAAKNQRVTTYQAMKRAKKMADRAREDDVYGGGTSFAAAQGHPTAYSEAHNDIHAPAPRARDKKARIDMLVGKTVHGHVAAQVRRNQARRDHRG